MAHEVDCSKMNECAVTSPSPGNEKLKFRKSTQIDNVRFVVYADFQSIIKESELNSENSWVVQIHEPYLVGYYVKCSFDDNLSHYESYRGTDPAQYFSEELWTWA